jgi:hypothetical protein
MCPGKTRAAPAATLVRLQVDPIAYGKLVVSCDPEAFVDYLRRELVGFRGAAAACSRAHIHRLTVPQAIRLSYDDERLGEIASACGS